MLFVVSSADAAEIYVPGDYATIQAATTLRSGSGNPDYCVIDGHADAQMLRLAASSFREKQSENIFIHKWIEEHLSLLPPGRRRALMTIMAVDHSRWMREPTR